MRKNKCKGQKGKYRKNKWILRKIRKGEEREREKSRSRKEEMR